MSDAPPLNPSLLQKLDALDQRVSAAIVVKPPGVSECGFVVLRFGAQRHKLFVKPG